MSIFFPPSLFVPPICGQNFSTQHLLNVFPWNRNHNSGLFSSTIWAENAAEINFPMVSSLEYYLHWMSPFFKNIIGSLINASQDNIEHLSQATHFQLVLKCDRSQLGVTRNIAQEINAVAYEDQLQEHHRFFL